MKNKYIVVVCVVLSALIVWISRAQILTGGDPSNYMSAVIHGFDMNMARPHPPGYPFFILLWKALSVFPGVDLHSIIIFTNFCWYILALVGVYCLAKELFDDTVALYAVLLTAMNPVLMYYTASGEIYSFDAAYSSLAIYLLLRCPAASFPFAALMIGASGGFRLSSFILLFPAFVVICFLRRRELFSARSSALKNGAAFIAGILLWFIPEAVMQGGGGKTIDWLVDSGQMKTMPLQQISVFITVLFWMINIQFFLFLSRWKKLWQRVRGRSPHVLVILTWLIFPSLFFMIKHYAKGYALILLPAAVISSAFCIASIHQKFARRMALSLTALAGLVVFFCVPFRPFPLQSKAEHDNRSFIERIESTINRGMSYWSPSYQHLRNSDRFVSSISDSIMALTPPGAYIVCDPAAGRLTYTRVYEITAPGRYYLMQSQTSTGYFHVFWKGDVKTDFRPEDLFLLSDAYLVTDKRLAYLYAAKLNISPLSTGEYYSLFKIEHGALPVLWQTLKEYFL